MIKTVSTRGIKARVTGPGRKDHIAEEAPDTVNGQSGSGTNDGAYAKVEYSVSSGLAARLARSDISIAFTSYQSGLLYFIGRNPDGGINIHQAAMPKPMGLCQDDKGGLILTGGFQIMRFENVLEPDQRINHVFDACYVRRLVHANGSLDAHDVGVDDEGQPIFVNTRFDCLATVSPRHSFAPVWRPPFISAVSRSDTIDGWRDRRADGGIVVDVKSGETVCEGLSMPHSPRLHDGWI